MAWGVIVIDMMNDVCKDIRHRRSNMEFPLLNYVVASKKRGNINLTVSRC